MGGRKGQVTVRAHLHVGDGETAATLRLRALAALLLLRARRRHRPRLRAGGGKGGGFSWVKLQRRATGHSCVREAGWGMGAKKAGPNSSSPSAVRTPSEEEPKAAKTHISLRHLRPTSPRDPRLDCHRSHVTPPRTRVDYAWGLFPVRTPSATCNRSPAGGRRTDCAARSPVGRTPCLPPSRRPPRAARRKPARRRDKDRDRLARVRWVTRDDAIASLWGWETNQTGGTRALPKIDGTGNPVWVSPWQCV